MPSYKSLSPNSALLAALEVFPGKPEATTVETEVSDRIGALSRELSAYAQINAGRKECQGIENLALDLEKIAVCFAINPEVLDVMMAEKGMDESGLKDAIALGCDPDFVHPKVFSAFTVLDEAGSDRHVDLMKLLCQIAEAPKHADADAVFERFLKKARAHGIDI